MPKAERKERKYLAANILMWSLEFSPYIWIHGQVRFVLLPKRHCCRLSGDFVSLVCVCEEEESRELERGEKRQKQRFRKRGKYSQTVKTSLRGEVCESLRDE